LYAEKLHFGTAERLASGLYDRMILGSSYGILSKAHAEGLIQNLCTTTDRKVAKWQSGKVGYQDFFGTLFLDVKNNSVGTAFI